MAELVSRLFRELKELRVGITAFGDIDAGATYDIKHQPLSADEAAIIDFVTTVPVSGSWTAEECYELALHEARSQPWRSDAIKTLVIIGDTYPNEKNANPKKLDWQEEAKALKAEGVTIYGVQCLFNVCTNAAHQLSCSFRSSLLAHCSPLTVTSLRYWCVFARRAFARVRITASSRASLG